MSKFSTVSATIIGNKGKAEEIISQNERLATAAFRSQISGLENLKVDRELALESAKAAFTNAITPSVTISDRIAYMNSIASARASVIRAEKDLEDVLSDLSFYSALRADYFDAVIPG